MIRSNSFIEDSANKILEKTITSDGKIVFPINPFHIITNYNINVKFSDFDKLEGMLFYDYQNSSLIAINKNRGIHRQRFTLAHELGHYFLHTSADNMNFICTATFNKQIEREAEKFAGYLLMPTFEMEKQIKKYTRIKEFVTLEEALYIAEYFGVSFSSCVHAIAYRFNKLEGETGTPELAKRIANFKPNKKREELFEKTNDLELLKNTINYSYFSILNTHKITGIKFIQELVYHESRLENIDIEIDDIKEIYADLRINGGGSKYCCEANKSIVETLGDIEMNKYCLETEDKLDIFKLQTLHKKLYSFSPYPEAGGLFKDTDNIIIGGTIQPSSIGDLFLNLGNINEQLIEVLDNIEKYTISEYIEKVAIIHYQITVLHPFPDGNGRISRGFLNWMLRLKKLPPIYIDSSTKAEYLMALSAIDNGKDSDLLQLIIIKGIIRTMTSIHQSWKQ